jgi:hypothetical protein
VVVRATGIPCRLSDRWPSRGLGRGYPRRSARARADERGWVRGDTERNPRLEGYPPQPHGSRTLRTAATVSYTLSSSTSWLFIRTSVTLLQHHRDRSARRAFSRVVDGGDPEVQAHAARLIAHQLLGVG